MPSHWLGRAHVHAFTCRDPNVDSFVEKSRGRIGRAIEFTRILTKVSARTPCMPRELYMRAFARHPPFDIQIIIPFTL